MDYDGRAALLHRALTTEAGELWAAPDDGAPKMLVTARALLLRRTRPGSLGPGGTYTPLPVTGQKADHVVAFLRGDDVAVFVPRLVMGIEDGWADTAVTLPEGAWTDDLSQVHVKGGTVPLRTLTAAFPVGLLTRS